MGSSRVLISVLLVLTVLCVPLLTGCGSSVAPTVVPTPASAAVSSTQAPTATPAAAPSSPTPAPTKGPAVGGTLVWLQAAEPDTLDAGVTAGGAYSNSILRMLGATLVAKSVEGKYVPYLAESWTVSEDGMNWDFRLRKGVKFHDGTPVTAESFAWTFNRDKDPETKSAAAGPNLARIVTEAQAVDDLTLRLVLIQPYFAMLEGMALPLLQPLSKAAVESGGEQYGRNPMGTGPYKFKSWTTGVSVVLERNPDYTWAPPYEHQGPAYIQTIEFRIISEQSTQVAGLEAGEIDMGLIAVKDLLKFQDAKKFQLFQSARIGVGPYVLMNVSKPPFDDVRVRQAINYALDREAFVKVIALGSGIVHYGPITPAVMGYWPGVEAIGYKFDLAKAKDLMKQAGYVSGSDGILTKDGKALALVLKTFPSDEYVRSSEIVKQQLDALGIELEIQQQEFGVQVQQAYGGDYQIALFGMGYGEADLMFMMFHSSMVGGMNSSQLKDPELDAILEQTRKLADPVKRQEACDAAQKWIVEHAIIAPLYAQMNSVVVSARVKGVTWSERTSTAYLHDAYIETQ